MKRIILIIGLIFMATNAHSALLLLFYEKMRMAREQESILKCDSLKAENGNVHMQMTCALRYWGKDDYRTARHFLSKAIVENNDTAKVYLAEMNYYGYGLPAPDVNSALQLAKEALNSGNGYAYFIIGKSFYDNHDFENAFKCFTSVPDDYPNIRLNYYYIAKCYRYGRGVRLDIETSNSYFVKANMSRTPFWWEKHFHRIKELSRVHTISKFLEIGSNPELSKISYLSTTKLKEEDTTKFKIDKIKKNIERAQKRYEH